MEGVKMPTIVAARFKARTIMDRSKSGIAGSNLSGGIMFVPALRKADPLFR